MAEQKYALLLNPLTKEVKGRWRGSGDYPPGTQNQEVKGVSKEVWEQVGASTAHEQDGHYAWKYEFDSLNSVADNRPTIRLSHPDIQLIRGRRVVVKERGDPLSFITLSVLNAQGNVATGVNRSEQIPVKVAGVDNDVQVRNITVDVQAGQASIKVPTGQVRNAAITGNPLFKVEEPIFIMVNETLSLSNDEA